MKYNWYILPTTLSRGLALWAALVLVVLLLCLAVSSLPDEQCLRSGSAECTKYLLYYRVHLEHLIIYLIY